MKPTLGVLITYHNEGKLLTRCLTSFFPAGAGPDEILIYDDASTIRPEEFIPSGISARVIRGESCIGPAKGRNILLKESKADYIHFHDSDDWVLSSWESAQRLAMQKSTDVIFTEVQSFKKGQPFVQNVVGFQGDLTGDQLLSFCARSFVLVPSATIKRELAVKLGGFRESLWQSEDYDFYVRLAAQMPTVQMNLESLVCIELRDQSRSKNQVETFSSALQALMYLRNEVPRSAYPDLAEKAAMVGSRLFQLKERELAHDAFWLSKSFGKADFAYQKPFFRWIARQWGQAPAEYLAAFYRFLFPSRLRILLRG